MTKTTNYQLPKWEKTDRIQMKDFNDMTATLDAALAAKSRVITGTYTGTGKDNCEIALGTRPKAVLVCTEYGVMWTSGGVYGGLALDGTPTKARTDTGTVYSLQSGHHYGHRL